MMARRKRAAARWFKIMCRSQAPQRAIYAGIMAAAIEMGVPSRQAIEVAYSFVNQPNVTLRDICEAVSEESAKCLR